jgi:hypothetical protein
MNILEENIEVQKLLGSLQDMLNVSQQLLYETQQTLIDEILKTVVEDGEFTYDGKDYKISLDKE